MHSEEGPARLEDEAADDRTKLLALLRNLQTETSSQRHLHRKRAANPGLGGTQCLARGARAAVSGSEDAPPPRAPRPPPRARPCSA